MTSLPVLVCLYILVAVLGRSLDGTAGLIAQGAGGWLMLAIAVLAVRRHGRSVLSGALDAAINHRVAVSRRDA